LHQWMRDILVDHSLEQHLLHTVSMVIYYIYNVEQGNINRDEK
jgi:hypothetical protein